MDNISFKSMDSGFKIFYYWLFKNQMVFYKDLVADFLA